MVKVMLVKCGWALVLPVGLVCDELCDGSQCKLYHMVSVLL